MAKDYEIGYESSQVSAGSIENHDKWPHHSGQDVCGIFTAGWQTADLRTETEFKQIFVHRKHAL